MKAARDGSKIAMEMLVSLPDMGASFKKDGSLTMSLTNIRKII
jgi:hypothetical protein